MLSPRSFLLKPIAELVITRMTKKVSARKKKATKTKKTAKSQKRKSSCRLGFIPESQRARARFLAKARTENRSRFFMSLWLFPNSRPRRLQGRRGAETIVPLKLDFAAEKKGAWPSRPCEHWSTFSPLAHRNQRSRSQHTGGTHCAPLLKSKSKLLLVLVYTLHGFLADKESQILHVFSQIFHCEK